MFGGLNCCGDYSSATQAPERAKQGSLLRLAISGVTSQLPTSESNPTIKEAVGADKVIWLAGVLSSAPTVGGSRLLGILSAPPVTVTTASPCSGFERSQRSGMLHLPGNVSKAQRRRNFRGQMRLNAVFCREASAVGGAECARSPLPDLCVSSFQSLVFLEISSLRSRGRIPSHRGPVR